MKRLPLLCLALLLAVVFTSTPSCPAVAEPSFLPLNLKRLYLAGSLGLSRFPDADYKNPTVPVTGVVELKNSNLMAGALGLRLTPEIDMEIEWSHRKPDLTSITPDGGSKVDMGGEIRTTAIMLNGYYNFDKLWSVQPFLTGGLGIALQNGEFDDTAGVTADSSDSDMGLAWQLGGGVKYKVRKDLSFTTGYRYFGTTEIDFGDARVNYGSHEFRLGVEYDLSPQ